MPVLRQAVASDVVWAMALLQPPAISAANNKKVPIVRQ
jgi:hypothetical protein